MASFSTDPSVTLTPSPSLVSYLIDNQVTSPPANIQALVDGKSILLTVEDIRWLNKTYPTLPASILFSSSLNLPSPKFDERNPELEARCVKLRAQQDEKEYRAMTGNVRRDNEKTLNEEEPLKKQFKEVNSFLLLIMQFVVSVVCSFMFGYMSPYYLYGKTDMGGRLLFGIICGFAVGCADMYFVIRQLLEEDGIVLAKKID